MKQSQKQVAIQELMDVSGIRFGTSGVRGPVAEMSCELCFAYTSAFLSTVSATSGHVALAIDLRPSSPEIAAACAAAIEYAGLSVDYCGAIPTPALALYAQTQALPGIMVTGSHIPSSSTVLRARSPRQMRPVSVSLWSIYPRSVWRSVCQESIVMLIKPTWIGIFSFSRNTA